MGERFPPIGWGEDPLTRYFQDAYRNRWASFVNAPEASRLLLRIDKCYFSILDNWINPEPPIAALLAYRSHSAFRASCEHALAGQTTEVWPTLRVCLEFAAYCLHQAKNPELIEVWLRRHDGASSMEAALRAFTTAKVRATIKAGDPETETVFSQLYQRAIDFGAHPNQKAVTASLSIIHSDDKVEFNQAYLVGDSLQLQHGLRSIAQAGVCALNILLIAYPSRFSDVGMANEALELRNGL